MGSVEGRRRPRKRDRRGFPHPGQRFDVGGYRLHLHRQGRGVPAVVFDSALAGSSVSWSLVQPEVSRFTTACSYDRAGSGWSDPGPFPRTGARMARELRILLERAEVAGPYILVGHSYGGFTARLFAGFYPESTAGLVLLDAADVEQWVHPGPVDRRKLVGGAKLARRGAWLARLGIARLVVWMGSSGAARAAAGLAGLFSRKVPSAERQRLLSPVFRLPPESRRTLAWFWTKPEFYEALASQIETVPETAARTRRAGPFSGLPLTVVSAANEDPTWEGRQAELAKLSVRGRHLAAPDSGHWIPLDRPDLVVRVIREMVEEIRNGVPANSPEDSRR